MVWARSYEVWSGLCAVKNDTPIMCAVQLGSKKVSADGISALKRESGDEVIDEKLRGTAMDIGDVSLRRLSGLSATSQLPTILLSLFVQ